MSYPSSLKEALNVLRKSSPQAVEVEVKNHLHDDIKSYLYIKTTIEMEFKNELDGLSKNGIIFLCGSSGDGKSAILTRYSKDYAHRARFHLDATHSSAPHQNAIATLDKLFTEVTDSEIPLIVGINIGMMGNYVVGGADEHHLIKSSMRDHLNNQYPPTCPNHIFLDFERYPKFSFDEREGKSKFAKEVLTRLTSNNRKNPFWNLFQQDKSLGNDTKITANFSLLCMTEVQDVVIDALLKSRLVKDQFMTARSLLDFIHHLLTGDGYLFDNLFSGSDNELSQRIASFDPSTLRTKKIDQFILQFGLGIIENKFLEFKKNILDFGIGSLDNPASYIRMFYLLREVSIGNNFHFLLKENFTDELISLYAKFWNLHFNFQERQGNQLIIQKEFYMKIVISAIHHYMNRSAPQLKIGNYLINNYNGYFLTAKLDIKPNFNEINNDKNNNIGYINVFLKVSGENLPSLSVNINLLELMIKLNQGYRPNKHDKNTIIIFDDIVEKIIEIANQSKSLIIISELSQYEITNDNNEIFEVVRT